MGGRRRGRQHIPQPAPGLDALPRPAAVRLADAPRPPGGRARKTNRPAGPGPGGAETGRSALGLAALAGREGGEQEEGEKSRRRREL